MTSQIPNEIQAIKLFVSEHGYSSEVKPIHGPGYKGGTVQAYVINTFTTPASHPYRKGSSVIITTGFKIITDGYEVLVVKNEDQYGNCSDKKAILPLSDPDFFDKLLKILGE